MQLSPSVYKCFVRPVWFTKKYINNILQDYFDLDNKVVLDFGCGVGVTSTLFAPAMYIGIDCDDKRIKYAKELYPNHKFIKVDNNHIPLPDGSIDCILVMSVLHHIEDNNISAYLEEFKRLLSVGGHIIIHEPCLNEGKPLCNSVMKLFDKGDYIRYRDEYIKLLQANKISYEIINEYRQCICYNKILIKAFIKS